MVKHMRHRPIDRAQPSSNLPGPSHRLQREKAPPPLAPLGRRAKQRVARGKEPIDGRLDLHGLTQREAHATLIARSCTRQARAAPGWYWSSQGKVRVRPKASVAFSSGRCRSGWPCRNFASGSLDSRTRTSATAARARSIVRVAAATRARSENKPAQIGVLRQVADVLLHVFGVDLHRFAGAVRCGERHLVEDPLHHRLQTASADVLDRWNSRRPRCRRWRRSRPR